MSTTDKYGKIWENDMKKQLGNMLPIDIRSVGT